MQNESIKLAGKSVVPNLTNKQIEVSPVDKQNTGLLLYKVVCIIIFKCKAKYNIKVVT